MKLGLRVILITGMVGIMATSCTSARTRSPGGETGTGPPPLTVPTRGPRHNRRGQRRRGHLRRPGRGQLPSRPGDRQPHRRVIWFHRLPAGEVATDFRTQTYRGQPVLT
jgi:hypothetical protein